MVIMIQHIALLSLVSICIIDLTLVTEKPVCSSRLHAMIENNFFCNIAVWIWDWAHAIRDFVKQKTCNSIGPYYVSQLELWSIWLSGFVLIVLSLYATQRLPSFKDHSGTSKLYKEAILDSKSLSITIFSAPKPFNGCTGARQTLAIRSWLALSPYITVVLYSQDPSVSSFAGSFDSRVLVDANIDFSFLGTPFFHSMITKSRSYTSEISVIIDPETVILSGFMSTLNHVYELDHDWLLIASAQNVSHFPFHLDESGKHWQTDNGKWVKIQEMQKILKHNSQWNHCYTRMLMAWNSKDMPLHNGVLPPFMYGKGIHNSWVIHEAMSSEFRFVFDASWTITSFHLNGEDNFNPPFGNSSAIDIENRNWEYIGNSHMGAHYGSFFYSEANYSSLVKLLKCNNQYIMVDIKKTIVYPIGHQSAMNQMKEKIFPSWLKENTTYCIARLKSEIRSYDCSLKDQKKIPATIELPFSLKSLLSITADKTKTVILTVAGYSYKDMLMSWVCRLRKLSIENFIVCALDQETYQFSILQGIPVFTDPAAPSNISFDDCHFGSKCFQRVTKVKSRIVLKILKLGYNVLLSDTDVYWFKNPVHLLHSFGPAVFAAQSDEYQKQGPINLPRRLNSGFYYAHSDFQTIAAIEKVVRHAETSGLSEQPSFYDTLCGKGGSNRVGDNRCVEPETNLTVHFLDRDHFPNGAYQELWLEKNVKASCLKKGCYIIHNNWISGRLKKLERQVLSGLWDYDPGTRMCVRSWHEDGETFRLHIFQLQAMLKRVAHSLGLVEHTDKKDSRRKNHPKGRRASPEFSKNFVVRITHAGGHQELYRHAVPASKLMTKYPGMCVARPEVFTVPHESVLWREDLLLPGHKYLLIPFRDVEKLKRKHPEQRENKEARGVVDKEMVMESKARSPSGYKHKENDDDKVKVPNGVAVAVAGAGYETLDAKITRSHNHRENGKMKEPNGVGGQEMLEKRSVLSPNGCKGQENIKGKETRGLLVEEEILNTNVDRSVGEGGVVEDSFFSAKDFYVSKEKSARTSRRKGIKGKKPFVPPLPRTRPYRSLGWQPSLPTVKELSP
ncbi:hypothetical protein VNO77_03635 [Canavalia gladiata]|uniref:Nucleotide-diphospho-sugar transferase domain-containing protein n=1 Tax=Canavalia gladiata TaxID=3824 RepID=A0AAN9R438_CANGL